METFPTAFTIPFGRAVMVAALTSIIPARQYHRAMNETLGRKAPVPGAYHQVEPNPRGLGAGLIGTRALSGALVAMVYFGRKPLNPDYVLSRGGMASMLGTVWRIFLAYGGVIERARAPERLIGPLIPAARPGGARVATLVGANVLASDQSIAVARPGRMVRPFARPRRQRRRDLAAEPVEQPRRLYGGDPRRSDDEPLALCLLQPAQSRRFDRLGFAFLGLRMSRRIPPAAPAAPAPDQP